MLEPTSHCRLSERADPITYPSRRRCFKLAALRKGIDHVGAFHVLGEVKSLYSAELRSRQHGDFRAPDRAPAHCGCALPLAPFSSTGVFSSSDASAPAPMRLSAACPK